jgi:hypothetical protein
MCGNQMRPRVHHEGGVAAPKSKQIFHHEGHEEHEGYEIK